MRPRPSPAFVVVERAVLAYARVEQAVAQLATVARLAADGALGRALDADEQTRLTIRLYDLAGQRYEPARGLWDWEEAWFARRLPPPPARVLIGAAGAGREALALADRGYHVAAFEPAPRMCARAADLCGGRFPVVRADYRDLADAPSGRGPLAALADAPWDAVLFGWTSLSHILDPAVRTAALAAADRLAPRGPLLVSYVARLGESGAARSRVWRAARRLGAAAASARGRGGTDDGVQFDRAIGFLRPFGPEDLVAMAGELARDVSLEPDAGFPHATLSPRDGRTPGGPTPPAARPPTRG